MKLNKIGRLILSVAIAFGLWWYVISAVSPGFTENVANIPVVLDGESVLTERGLMITGVSAEKVGLRLYGNRSDLVRINAGNTAAKVDLSQIREPGTQIPLSFTPAFPGELNAAAITVEARSPALIYVSVANRITKEVPVEVRWLGSAAEGFITDRENRVLDFPTVMISGPEGVINEITKASIEVNLAGRTESVSENFLYTLCDEGGTPVDSALVTTNAEQIHLDVKIQKVRDIALTYNLIEGAGARQGDAEITMSLDTLRISGSETALAAIGDSLSLGNVNLAELPKSGSVTLPIVLPEGINNLTGASEVTVDVRFKGLATKELILDNITAVNVPEGTEAEIITTSMTVVVRGPADIVSKVAERDVSVTVDLSGAELGTSTYKPSFTFRSGFEAVGVLQTNPVSVALTEQ